MEEEVLNQMKLVLKVEVDWLAHFLDRRAKRRMAGEAGEAGWRHSALPRFIRGGNPNPKQSVSLSYHSPRRQTRRSKIAYLCMLRTLQLNLGLYGVRRGLMEAEGVLLPSVF